MTVSTQPISAQLQERMARELARRRAYSPRGFGGLIESGRGSEVAEGLVFFADPAVFASQVCDLLAVLEQKVEAGNLGVQSRCLEFLVDLGLAVRSFLPAWNLTNQGLHGENVLAEAGLLQVSGACMEALGRWETLAPDAAVGVLASLRSGVVARLRAEQAARPEVMAGELAGDSLVACVRNVTKAISGSNLRRLAEMRSRGETLTELG